MVTRTGRALLANLRTWWPELTAVAILTATGLAPAHGTLFLAVFCVSMIGIGWAMGFRHRHRPVWEVIRRMDAKLDRALAADERPDAEVRHLHSV